MSYLNLNTKYIQQQTNLIKQSLIKNQIQLINIYKYKNIIITTDEFFKLFRNKTFQLHTNTRKNLIIKSTKDLVLNELGMRFLLEIKNIKNVEIYKYALSYMNKTPIKYNITNLHSFLEKYPGKYHIFFNYYRTVTRHNVLNFKQLSDNSIEVKNLELKEVLYGI